MFFFVCVATNDQMKTIVVTNVLFCFFDFLTNILFYFLSGFDPDVVAVSFLLHRVKTNQNGKRLNFLTTATVSSSFSSSCCCC